MVPNLFVGRATTTEDQCTPNQAVTAPEVTAPPRYNVYLAFRPSEA